MNRVGASPEVPGARQSSLRDPRMLEMATESPDYNAKRGLLSSPCEKALANPIKGAHGPTMHNNQAGPEPFAERVSP
jgi:hypothetical protein